MDAETHSLTKISTIVPQQFQSLGPMLLISIGYIDPGKWAAIIEGGARFGFDIVLLFLAFNCTAILCQYISAIVAVATGKNLAKICSEEYNRPTCVLLGIQAELSVIALELNMILGISLGLNLIFGMDTHMCILLTAIDAVVFPFLTTLVEKFRTELLFMSIAGLALFYVIGVLSSHLEIPPTTGEMIPRLKGESAYTLMSLLGASIPSHNFYLHSYIVQKQQQRWRLPGISTRTLCHDHLFAIVCIFGIIFLVNVMMLLSAATVFHTAGLAITFQDIVFFMDQMVRNSTASLAFFLLLFFSSQITTLTWNVGAPVLVHDLFGVAPSPWIHRITIKIFVIVLSLLCAWNMGAEGIYQLLIFSQVILALLLPSSFIPLFRVASSGLIMGPSKMPHLMEMLAFLAFLGMLALNIFFILEILFGDADWIGWTIGESKAVPSFIILIVAFISLSSMLWLVATPIKSARVGSNVQMFNLDTKKELLEPFQHREKNKLNEVIHDGEQVPMTESKDLHKSIENSENCDLQSEVSLPYTIISSDQDQFHSSADVESYDIISDSSSLTSRESAPFEQVPLVSVLHGVSVGRLADAVTAQEAHHSNFPRKAEGEADMHPAVKDDDDTNVGDPEELPEEIPGSISNSTFEGSGSLRNYSVKGDDGGSGSLSRLSGLGRAARRQLAGILDEFWGMLYDTHGQLTQEAKTNRFDVILGFESKPDVSPAKANDAGKEYTKHSFGPQRGPLRMEIGNYGPTTTTRPQRMGNLDSSSGFRSGSASSQSSYIELLEAYVHNSRAQAKANEKRYSSLRFPLYSDERDYQPATIHGNLYGTRNDANGTSSFSRTLDPSTTNSASYVSNYMDFLTRSGQNFMASSPLPRVKNPSLIIDRNSPVGELYYDPSLIGAGGDCGPSSYPKKYHSLPDISGLAISSRISSLADRTVQRSNPIGPRTFDMKMPYERYMIDSLRAEVLPYATVSPSKPYGDPYSIPLSPDSDGESLWSKQPFEHIFGVAGKPRDGGSGVLQNTVFHSDSEAKLLHSLRSCILKLLKLEGSDWLFRQNGGVDEDLIERVASRERLMHKAECSEFNQADFGKSPVKSPAMKHSLRNEEASLVSNVSLVPHCGEGCVWQAGLIVSFGVWSVRRILELSQMESRPEMWGKYTYTLNHLQGILDLAFFKPRTPISPCSCLQIPSSSLGRSIPALQNGALPVASKLTNAAMLLELIHNVETAVSRRKGKTGTAAGDVAFPKGKENLASVLKRYKSRLSNKSAGTRI